jgi:hypothetical protein
MLGNDRDISQATNHLPGVLMSHEHHDHSQHGHHNHQTHPKRGIHHSWQFWVAVVLMLAAMGYYVASMDDSILPGGGEEPPVPAMAE